MTFPSFTSSSPSIHLIIVSLIVTSPSSISTQWFVPLSIGVTKLQCLLSCRIPIPMIHRRPHRHQHVWPNVAMTISKTSKKKMKQQIMLAEMNTVRFCIRAALSTISVSHLDLGPFRIAESKKKNHADQLDNVQESDSIFMKKNKRFSIRTAKTGYAKKNAFPKRAIFSC